VSLYIVVIAGDSSKGTSKDANKPPSLPSHVTELPHMTDRNWRDIFLYCQRIGQLMKAE
jgi:hypothetical protein